MDSPSLALMQDGLTGIRGIVTGTPWMSEGRNNSSLPNRSSPPGETPVHSHRGSQPDKQYGTPELVQTTPVRPQRQGPALTLTLALALASSNMTPIGGRVPARQVGVLVPLLVGMHIKAVLAH